MYGVASRVRRDQEAGAAVLRFMITAPDGTRATVEMRGDEIRGMVDDGDRVIVRSEHARNGILRTARVRNQTTGSVVTVWHRPMHRRAGKFLATALGSALVSAAVTIGAQAITGDHGEQALGRSSRSDDDAWGLVAALVIWGAVAGCWAVAQARRHRDEGPVWPVLLAVAIGFGAGATGVLAIADG